MDLKIRNVPEDQVLVIQEKLENLESAVKNIYVELFKKKLKKMNYEYKKNITKEVLDRLIDTLIENNHLMDKVATHFGIEID